MIEKQMILKKPFDGRSSKQWLKNKYRLISGLLLIKMENFLLSLWTSQIRHIQSAVTQSHKNTHSSNSKKTPQLFTGAPI